MIRISDNLALPLEAVTQTFGILAVRGAGKSNCAAVMAEQMFMAELPFVVVDPVGSWWGLRASSDSHRVGLAIPIFGGRHGDVPLERTGGQVIADLVADERLSCVLDCSEFSEGDKIRFLIDFAERLYRRNQDPLHLFLEEADDYIPQRPFREQARLLRAFENIVRRGRARGLGITMITQRSAALNKNVLTQIETLIVLRTTSPQDRKAIEGWVEYHGQAKTLLESLPGLEDGEAWVWSPSWLKTLKRVKILRRLSFDSAATPKEVHGKRPPATLADVDLGTIQKRIVATIERAKAEDPRELRARIAELEREAKNRPQAEPEIIEVPILNAKDLQQLEDFRLATDRWGEMATTVTTTLTRLISLVENHPRPAVPNRPNLAQIAPLPSPPPRKASTSSQRSNGPEEGLDRGGLRVLETITMLNHRQLPVDREAVARWMGIHPNGSRYLRALATLRAEGYLEHFSILKMSPACSNFYERGDDGALSALKEPFKQRVFREVLAAKGPLTRETLAERLGIHPNGSRYLRALAWLRQMHLIPERGSIVPTEGVYR